VKTNDKGYYIYMGLPAAGATYNIRILKDGNLVYELRGIRTSTGEIKRVDIDLQKERALQEQQMTEEQKAAREKALKQAQQFQTMKENFNLGLELLRNPSVETICSARCPGADSPDHVSCVASCQHEVSQGNVQQIAYSEAVSALEKARDADPSQMAVFANLARAYDLTGQNDKSIEAYKQAIALKPEEAALYNNLGQVYVKQGNLEEAEKAFAKAAELNPQQAGAFYYNLGVTFYNAGNLGGAVEPLRKAVEIDPKRADAYYLLGVCLYNQAEFKQEGKEWVTILKPGTREAFEKYLELAPDGKFAEMAKQNLEAINATIPTDVRVKKK
jgi:Tfp pilus assembly protein PilF